MNDITEEMPDAVRLIANTCPARLNDPENICAGYVKEYRRRLLGYITRFLSEGVESGDFAPVPLEETAYLIFSVINGMVRYSRVNRGPDKNLREAAVEFCRRSLMYAKKR